jgi:hypothetical protein
VFLRLSNIADPPLRFSDTAEPPLTFSGTVESLGNISGAADHAPFQSLWYCGHFTYISVTADLLSTFWRRRPRSVSTFLAPWTPFRLNLPGVVDPVPSQPSWRRGPRSVSTFLASSTPFRLNLPGAVYPVPSQPFWHCLPRYVSTFLAPWTPFPFNVSGIADPLSIFLSPRKTSQPFWCCGPRPRPRPLSTSLVLRTTYPKLSHTLRLNNTVIMYNCCHVVYSSVEVKDVMKEKFQHYRLKKQKTMIYSARSPP